MTFRRFKRGVVANMVGAELFTNKEPEVYWFDGVSMYATIPDWTPLGYSFEVTARCAPSTVDGTDQYIVSNDAATSYMIVNSIDSYLLAAYKDVGGVTRLVKPVKEFVAGRADSVAMAGTPENVKVTHSGVSAEDANPYGINDPVNYISRIGAYGAGLGLFDGPIAWLELKDRAPIQNTDVCVGNATRYGRVPQISVPKGEGYTLEWDGIKPSDSFSSAWAVVGGYQNTNNPRLQIYGSSHASNADVMQMFFGETGTTMRWDDVMPAIAAGQHYHIKITIPVGAGMPTLHLDGKLIPETNGSGDVERDLEANHIGHMPGSVVPLPDGAIQNLEIKNTTTGERWMFPLNEGSGTEITNTDPVTGDPDYLPVSDTYACVGNGTRYGTIPAIQFDGSTADWTIKFDWIRQEVTGTGATILFGDETGNCRFVVDDSGSGSPNSLYIARDSGQTVFLVGGVFDGVTVGQHISVEIRSVGGTTEVFVDGVLRGTDVAAQGQMTISAIMKANNSILWPSDSALQNMEVTLSTGERWFFPLNEGSGTEITNTDPVTGPGNSGAWTPDADWQYIGNASYGEWTPDADWQYIPNNSRHYPMTQAYDDDSGTIKNILDPSGATDGTIVNYNPDNWKSWPSGDPA